MKILIVHNSYKLQGGEDIVVSEEYNLLSSRHEVQLIKKSNVNINGFLSKLVASLLCAFNPFTLLMGLRHNLDDVDVIHVHNYFPIFSPSIFWMAKLCRIPVVHTLHNYRSVCPTALLLHQGCVCEKSISDTSWWALREKVYRNSWIGTFFVCVMVELNKKISTWTKMVDRYIALTEFSRKKFVEAGWPSDKISVKPNFINDPFNGKELIGKKGGYALYVGRLSPEKGIDILLQTWSEIDYPLKIAGDGPLKDKLISNPSRNIEFLGSKTRPEILTLIKNADFLIMPSIWYETFGVVLIESFACGTPALVSRLGGMEEIVSDGVTGLHFHPGDVHDLAKKINWMLENPDRIKQMGLNARLEYLAKYTPEKNYEMLIQIYRQAIELATKSK